MERLSATGSSTLEDFVFTSLNNWKNPTHSRTSGNPVNSTYHSCSIPCNTTCISTTQKKTILHL